MLPVVRGRTSKTNERRVPRADQGYPMYSGVYVRTAKKEVKNHEFMTTQE